MQILLVFLAIFFIAIIFIVSTTLDSGRLESYLKQRGAKLLSKSWQPFGKGWFGEKSDRIYRITYLDKEGNTHQAWCKTSIFSGVYLSDDTILKTNPNRPKAETEEERLRAENERLRAELKHHKGR